MSSFTDDQIEVRLLGNNEWLLLKPFRYYLDEKNFIEVPKGFITDFASIPRVFWSFFHPIGRYAKAAVIHDWLYFEGIFSRSKSDDIFYDGMKVLGVSWWKRFLIYQAVRYFGWWSWLSCRKRKECTNYLKK